MRQRLSRCLAAMLVVGMLLGMAMQHPNATQYLAWARSASDQFAWGRAIEWYATAQRLAPDDAAPVVGLARIWYWQNKLDRAQQAIDRASILAPHDAAIWLLAGEIAAHRADMRVAQADWQRAYRLDPDGAAGQAAALAAADAALDAGDTTAVLDMTASSRTLSSALLGDLGIALLHSGQSARARDDFAAMTSSSTAIIPYRDLAEHWAGTPANLAALGYQDIAAGRAALAIAPLRLALSAQPDYGAGDAYLAWALWQTGSRDEARARLAQAQSQAPDEPLTRGVTASILIADGQPALALAGLDEWLATHSATAPLLLLAASAAVAANDPASEERSLWTLANIAAGSDRPEALRRLAQFYVTTGLGRGDGRAAWAVTTAMSLAPTDAATSDLVAQWALLNGHADEAFTALHRALQQDPTYALAYAHLGRLEFRAGNLVAAGLDLEQAANCDTTGATSAIIGPLLAILGNSMLSS